jgi:hypothetical protein
MKKEFTKEYILSNRGCYSEEQVEGLSFINKETITLKDMLTSELSLKNKFWWLCKKCELTKDENILIAIKCAKIVLHLYEDKYPKDDRPRKAILAAEKYLETHDVNAAANAAYAAANAAANDAAYAAANAAANAAYAAAANATVNAAANAAVNAAYATAYAADAAAATAYAAAYADAYAAYATSYAAYAPYAAAAYAADAPYAYAAATNLLEQILTEYY